MGSWSKTGGADLSKSSSSSSMLLMVKIIIQILIRNTEHPRGSMTSTIAVSKLLHCHMEHLTLFVPMMTDQPFSTGYW
eukprot:8545182-Ditylum_brightwellii.AAC.1